MLLGIILKQGKSRSESGSHSKSVRVVRLIEVRGVSVWGGGGGGGVGYDRERLGDGVASSEPSV